MKSIGSLVIIVLLTSCNYNSSNNYLVDSNVQGSYSSNQEETLDDDSIFFEFFREGEYDTIIKIWESDVKKNSLSSEVFDKRIAIYYMAIYERDKVYDPLYILERFDRNLYRKPLDFWPRYVYTDKLREILGPYECYALMQYDFTTYKRFSDPYLRLSHELWSKLGDSRLKDPFYTLNFAGMWHKNEQAEKVMDSLHVVFPKWSFIDTMKTYYIEARNYTDSLR